MKVDGREVGFMDMTDGTKQGDPVSALLFVWALDCVVRFKVCMLSVAFAVSTSLADDMADVVINLMLQGKRLSVCFKVLAKAAGLELNFEKCK